MAKILNRYIRDGDVTYLEVTRRNNISKVYFVIDTEDVSIAKRDLWYAMFCPKRKTFYLESRHKIKYHRLITHCPPELVVDHIDRDTYDNRKANLRICSIADNNRNRYYPAIQNNPKPTNTGIQYISRDSRGYFRVSYHKQRKGFKTLELAKGYLQQLKERIGV